MRKIVVVLAIVIVSLFYLFVMPPRTFLSQRLSNIARALVFKDSILQMFEENKNLTKRVLAIMETASNENIAVEQTLEVLSDYRALEKNYSHIIHQQLSESDKDWGDWSIEGQWAELLYQLILVDSRKSADSKRKIKDAIANAIMESKLFDAKYIEQYISDRLAYDRIQVGELE